MTIDPKGRRGGALRLDKNQFLRYSAPGNFSFKQGTVSLWACPDEELSRYAQRGEFVRQCLLAVHDRTDNQLKLWLDMTELTPRLRVRAGNGQDNYVIGLDIDRWPAGEWRQVQVSWRQPSSLAIRVGNGPWLERDIAPLSQMPDHFIYDVYLGSNAMQSAMSPLGRPDRFIGRIDDLSITDQWQSAEPTLEIKKATSRPDVHDLFWAIDRPQRVQLHVAEAKGDWAQRPVQIRMDLGPDWASQSAAQRRNAINGLRLVQHDPDTGKAVIFDDQEAGDSGIAVPFEIGKLSYGPSDLDLSFVHRGNLPAIYSLYFDPQPSDEYEPFPPTRVMVGNGGRLRLGQRGSAGTLSGGIRGNFDVFDPDGDGDLDLWLSFGDQQRNNHDLSSGHYFYENVGGPGHRALYAPPMLIHRGSTPAGFLTRVMVPQIVDVDNDGRSDLFMYSRKGSQWWSWVFENGRIRVTDYRTLETPDAGRAERGRLIDWDRDGQLDLLAGTAIYRGTQSAGQPPRFADKPMANLTIKGMASDAWESSPIGVLPTDWDGDGERELLGFGWLTRLFVHQPDPAQPTHYQLGQWLQTYDRHELQLPSVFPSPAVADFDGDGDLDLLWTNDGATIGWAENAAGPGQMPQLKQTAFLRMTDAYVDSGAMAIPWADDWDADGDTDLILGGASEFVWYVENVGDARNPVWDERVPMIADGLPITLRAGEDGSLLGAQEADWGYTNPVVADWDRDGQDDLIVAGIRGEVTWFRNVGQTGRPRLASGRLIAFNQKIKNPPTPTWLRYSRQGRELIVSHRTRPIVTDWDGDGWLDILMLDHESKWGLYRSQPDADGVPVVDLPKQVFELDDAYSRGMIWNRKPLTEKNWRPHYAGRTVGQLIDWDHDGQRDLLLDNVNARFYRNVSGPTARPNSWPVVFEDQGDLARQRLVKHNTGPVAADFDGDGWEDLLVGAESGRVFYFSRAYIEGGMPAVAATAIESQTEPR